jgi:hypothetical protein
LSLAATSSFIAPQAETAIAAAQSSLPLCGDASRLNGYWASPAHSLFFCFFFVRLYFGLGSVETVLKSNEILGGKF